MFLTAKQFLDEEEVKEFSIPQINGDNMGFKTGKKKYKPSIIPSPVFGSKVKDVIHVKPNEVNNSEVIKHYDAFRVQGEKYETNADKLRKYGTAFPEFNKITEEDRRNIYGYEDSEIINDFIDKLPSKKKNKKLSFIKSAYELEEGIEDTVSSDIPLEEKSIEDKKTTSDTLVETPLAEAKEENKLETLINDENLETTSQINGSFDFGFDSFDDITSNVDNSPRNNNSPEEVVKEEDVTATENEFSFGFDDFSDDVDSTSNEEEYDLETKAEDDKIHMLDRNSSNRDYLENYKFPPLSIFSKSSESTTESNENSQEKIDIINKTLLSFSIPGSVTTYTRGPSFSRYEVLLDDGVNVKKISQIELNLQAALGAKSIRIQAPIPGKKTIGIEVPNDKRQTVHYGDIISNEFISTSEPLEVTLGKNIDGEIVKLNIATTPHCLIGGATSSGKSVSMNTILISLLLKNKPDDLKMILIDPKQVEFSCYDDLPHLITPVISDPEMANAALKWAVDEMDRRYSILAHARAREIISYNKKALIDGEAKMPYILIVIDELADLMQTCSSDVEDSIKRLCQKARGCGIHLLVATQRPDVKTVSGSIKANIPTRIAFRVFSQTDSQVILDEGGAENLLGRGDMLIKTEAIPMRLQGAYIPDEEIDEVTEFIRDELTADYVFTHEDLQKRNERDKRIATKQEESPVMLYNAAMFCFNEGTCSINALQSEFNLGFSRAQKLVQSLENYGIVSEKSKSNKPRDILVDSAKIDEIFSNME